MSFHCSVNTDMFFFEGREWRKIIHVVDGQNDAYVFTLIGLSGSLVMEKVQSVGREVIDVFGADLVLFEKINDHSKKQGQVCTCPCYNRVQSSETLTLNCLDWSQEKLALQVSHLGMRYTRCYASSLYAVKRSSIKM